MSEDKRGQGGEFRGDFTRDTFDPAKNFTKVLMQQGRVQLDADWNEQVSILHHYMRQLGEDLMGPHAAPADENGNFKINEAGSDVSIAAGKYYVKGILCKNDNTVEYTGQKPQPYPFVELERDKQYLVYLDVWERNLSFIEDDSIREKALGGADTSIRSKIVWQVRVIEWSRLLAADMKIPDADKPVTSTNFSYTSFLEALSITKETKPGTGQLRARAKTVGDENKDPCLTAPEASYRGGENQLYRVEIHNRGKAKENEGDEGCATFKWSRENGSVIFPIIGYQDGGDENIILELEHLGRDDRFSLKVNDWVEVVNKNVALQNQANPLLQVTQVDREKNQVFLRLREGQGKDIKGLLSIDPSYLRRWDQKDDNAGKDGVLFTESNQTSSWISLENGIEIQFTPPENGTSNPHYIYQTGDYWLIPARTATGDVEWPVDENNNPKALSPHGVEHYYAPLAKITVKADGTIGSTNDDVVDLRRKLKTYFDLKV